MSTIYDFNSPPVRGSAYTFYVSLVSQADTDIFQKTVTLAAGDVKVSKDGGAENNITSLPVEIGTSGILAVTLSSTEMTADVVTVRFSDAADDEWQDGFVEIRTMTDQLDGAGDSIAADVWAAATRTLTASAASTTATVSGSNITIVRGDTLSASLTGLGDLTGYTSLWFTVKADKNDDDDESIVQIKLNSSGTDDGLLYINGAAPTHSSDGSITIDSTTSGSITIALDESLTDDLNAGISYFYDVQVLDTGVVSTLTQAIAYISADVTRDIT